jgi:glycosyltransferase involved in cell wall biosynthesis
VRIVHVSDCYLPRIGGIEHQIHDLAQHQRDSGQEVEIVTSVVGARPSSAADTNNHTVVADRGEVFVHRPDTLRTKQPHDIRYRATREGRDVALGGAYDVIHLHVSTWSPLAYLTARSAVRAGIPTVVTLHSLWSYASPLFAAADVAARWSDWPSVWSAVSSVAAERLQGFVGADRPVAILPNGVEPVAWRVPPTARDSGRVVIATVGRLTERKRPRQLLQMLRQVRARVPASIHLEVLVIGDGPLRTRLQRYLDRHDMSWWVHLVGAVDHEALPRIFSGADLYVAPSTLESFGIAALEARCAGLPVVAFAGSGIADFFTMTWRECWQTTTRR